MSVSGVSMTGGGGGGSQFSTSLLPTSTPSSQLNFTATLTLPFPPPGSTTLTSLVTLRPTSITTTTTATTSSNFISTRILTTISVTALPNPEATAALAAESSLLNQNAFLTRTNLTVTAVLGSLSFLLLIILLIVLFFCYRRRNSKNADSESPPFTSLAPRPAPQFIAPRSPAPQIPLPEQMRETSLSMGPRGGTADSYSRAILQAQPQFGYSQNAPRTSQQQTPSQFQFPYPSGQGQNTTSIVGGAALLSPSGTRRGSSQAQALASNPVSPPTRTRLLRSSSAPTTAPEPAPSIPYFPFQSTSTNPPTGLGVTPGTAGSRLSLFPSTTQGYPDPNISHDSMAGTIRPGTSGSGRPGTGGSGSGAFGAPLKRQRSVPMYHRALREQVEAEREQEAGREAVRLGRPVIAFERGGNAGSGVGERDKRKSGGSELSSEISFGSEEVEIGVEKDEDERRRGEASGFGPGAGQVVGRGQGDVGARTSGGGGGGGGGNGGQGTGDRGRVLHSTRASSGVFPEGHDRDSEDEDDREEKNIYS